MRSAHVGNGRRPFARTNGSGARDFFLLSCRDLILLPRFHQNNAVSTSSYGHKKGDEYSCQGNQTPELRSAVDRSGLSKGTLLLCISPFDSRRAIRAHQTRDDYSSAFGRPPKENAG